MSDKLKMLLVDQINIDPVNNPKLEHAHNQYKSYGLHFLRLVNSQCVENQMINLKNSAKSVNLCKHPIWVFNKVNSSLPQYYGTAYFVEEVAAPSKGGQETPSLLEKVWWGIPTLSVGTTLIVGEVERLTKVDRIGALKTK